MFKSLYSKLAAVLLGLFSLIGLIIVVVSLFFSGMYQQEINQKLNRGLAENLVSEKLLMHDSRINEEALKEIFHMLMVINPTIEIYLLDPEGNILAYSAPPGKVKRAKVDLNPIKTWLKGDFTIPIMGDDPRELQGKKVFSAARIPKQGKIEGYLYVILGSETYDSVVQKLKGSYILRLGAWVMAASLLFALIAGLLTFAFLTGRLKRLSSAMDAFRGGETLERIDLPFVRRKRGGDEIDQLGETFKQMAGRIEDQMNKLKKSDTLRRELLANVSHDLRTPLATLQGYIETLVLKDDSLTAEERRDYFDIAIKQCKRLNKLVSELFELSRLDATETAAQKEPFNLSELVQDVVVKFNLEAREKDIHITTNIGEGIPFVNADIALIERVLENLMENAIHYTPEGGSVSIVLTAEDGDVAVQVSDTGRGIPHEELPNIFDRFYQLDKSRSAGPRHSGLGLAITKRILELHNRSIQVKSIPDSGTIFTFRLSAHNSA